MEKTALDCIKQENKKLLGCILKGYSIEKTAQILYCSKSCVSYRTANLLRIIGVKTKFEFIIKIFSEILSKNKNEIKEKNKEIDILRKELNKLNRLLKQIILNIENKDNVLKIIDDYRQQT
ncbi:hypothetical protein IJ670_02070 [bacterium]|nr:hypothetical protein [bacterium]